jgi:hypothetical protein
MDISTRPIRRLPLPLSALQPHYDAIVAGPRYGGVIASTATRTGWAGLVSDSMLA